MHSKVVIWKLSRQSQLLSIFRFSFRVISNRFALNIYPKVIHVMDRASTRRAPWALISVMIYALLFDFCVNLGLSTYHDSGQVETNRKHQCSSMGSSLINVQAKVITVVKLLIATQGGWSIVPLQSIRGGQKSRFPPAQGIWTDAIIRRSHSSESMIGRSATPRLLICSNPGFLRWPGAWVLAFFVSGNIVSFSGW